MDLEDIVVRRICGRLSRKQISVLKACLAREEEAHRARRPDYIRLSAEFHVTLAEMGGSLLLLRYPPAHLAERTGAQAARATRMGSLQYQRASGAHRGARLRRCREIPPPDGHSPEAVLTRALDGATAAEDPGLRDILKRYARLSI